MGNNGYRARLTGRELYVYCFKKLDNVKNGICTNKRILSDRTGIEYCVLMNMFTRKGLKRYENEDVLILKVYTADLEKGSQSIRRRGKGGMENFVKNYIRQTNY
jgi:hypothetical protein